MAVAIRGTLLAVGAKDGRGLHYDVSGTSSLVGQIQCRVLLARVRFHGGRLRPIDLWTGENVHIDSTYEGYQYFVLLCGEYVVWDASDVWLTPPYRMVHHHIPSGKATVISEDNWVSRAAIHRNLVRLNTTKYITPDWFRFDIELYDIDTGVCRRVTTEAGPLAIYKLFFPHALIFVYRKIGIQPQNDLYVADLVKLGLVDETCYVIPGGGVLPQPE
ncbi:MAG: hypothetical protein ABI333_14940 [bacterium]